jgi:hypothetical protein
MKASKNSIHAKLYKFTYNSELPKNLCPYFWKLVSATMLFIPNLILQIPTAIYVFFSSIISKSKSEVAWYDCGTFRTTGVVFYFVTVLFGIYSILTYEWFKWFFKSYSYDGYLASLGGLFNSIIISVSLFFLIKFFIEEWKYKKTHDENGEPIEKPQSIFIEFIKAKYHTYCPQMEWDDKVK